MKQKMFDDLTRILLQNKVIRKVVVVFFRCFSLIYIGIHFQFFRRKLMEFNDLLQQKEELIG